MMIGNRGRAGRRIRLLGAFAALVWSVGSWGQTAPAVKPAQPASTLRQPPSVVFAPVRVAAPKLVVRTFSLNAIKQQLDGQWQGMILASDGNVYSGSSTHSPRHGGIFYRYDPRTAQLTVLCDDVTKVCGEDPATNPQGKLHSPIVESDGRLYFATHFSNEGPGAASRYTGAHVLAYDLATGQFHDLGIPHPNYTIYSAVAVDAARRRLYVFTTPIPGGRRDAGGAAVLHRLDLATGANDALATLRTGGYVASFWFLVDRRGDCWFTVNEEPGNLYCARAETGQVVRYAAVLPRRYTADGRALAPAERQNNRWWPWAQPLPDGESCIFSIGEDPMLWTFDASKAPDFARAFRPVAAVGPIGLGTCLAGDRLYYVQAANRSPAVKAPTGPDGHHLYSLRITDGAGTEIIDHGLLYDQDGRQPWRLEGMAADAAGHVYISGDWHRLPNDPAPPMLRYERSRDGQERYREEPRGQFFTVADVSAHLGQTQPAP